jgi:hypothetical protein
MCEVGKRQITKLGCEISLLREQSTPAVALRGPPSKCGREKELKNEVKSIEKASRSIDRVPMEVGTALATLNTV